MEGRADVSGIAPALQEIVFDPQTSGGLLISVAATEAQALCGAIQKDDPAAIIGEVCRREECSVAVV
jgi:selenide,water dikinase